MSEFVFRNLSVRLNPEGTPFPTILCQNGVTTVACGYVVTVLCTSAVTYPRTDLTICQPLPSRIPTDPWTITTITPVITRQSPLPDEAAQLQVLKDSLKERIARVEAREEQIHEAFRPSTVEKIDQLKAQLLEAVAELDEQRTRLESPSDD